MKHGTAAVLRGRREVAAGTVELTFLPEERIEFRAGQYCRVDLGRLRWPDRKSSRKFSIVNAPHERDRIVVVTRSGPSGYKRSLDALRDGDRVRIERVKGDLVLPSKPRRPLSLIAGGIGIAPFISMLRELDHDDRLSAVSLIYLNRERSSAAYLDELHRLAAKRPGFTFVPVMTRDVDWTGERRRLTAETLGSVLDEPRKQDHYVVGTPPMVDAAVDALSKAGVKSSRVHQEDFSGYGK
ncbi:ferredoxin--NADP reductase [Amnibacterium sp.]|uniref:ferredoxin--NADP reductase n=1 Tax=Amnibacterium sp. TaxID=1872496 RepID=UPI003F7B3A16